MTLAPPVAANPARSTSTSNENLSPTSPNAVTHSNPSPPPSSPGEHSSPTRTTPEPERPVEATALAKPFLAALREMSRDEQNAMIRLITRELGLEVGREASVALGVRFSSFWFVCA